MDSTKRDHTAWDLLAESAPRPSPDFCPRMTTIIPTFKCPHFVSQTLDSLVIQDYPDFEVIVIDASSPDRTIEAVSAFRDDRIRVYSVTDYNLYEMINRGISLCTGSYVNVLYPGDYYLSPDTLRFVASVIEAERQPDLVFSACLLRDSESDVRLLYRRLTEEYLHGGQQPTSLQACWWHTNTLVELGKFDKGLRIRGGYDLMSRFLKKTGLRAASIRRVLVDYRQLGISHQSIFRHFRETFRVLYRYFGPIVTLRWMFSQRDFYRSMRLWWQRMRVAFLGR